MKRIALVLFLIMTAAAFAGCTGDEITGKWFGEAETDEFTLSVELTIEPDGTADYDIIKVKKIDSGFSEFYGTLNWTIDEDQRIILYENDIRNPYRVLEVSNGTLMWSTLYTGLEHIPLERSLG